MKVSFRGRMVIQHRNFHGCVVDQPPPGFKVLTELCMGLQDEPKEQLLAYNQQCHQRGMDLSPDTVLLMAAKEAGVRADPSLPADEKARTEENLTMYNVLVQLDGYDGMTLNTATGSQLAREEFARRRADLARKSLMRGLEVIEHVQNGSREKEEAAV